MDSRTVRLGARGYNNGRELIGGVSERPGALKDVPRSIREEGPAGRVGSDRVTEGLSRTARVGELIEGRLSAGPAEREVEIEGDIGVTARTEGGTVSGAADGPLSPGATVTPPVERETPNDRPERS